MGAEGDSTGTTATTPTETDSVDWKARAEAAEANEAKWKGLSRKHEDRVKELNSKAEKWDKYEKENQTDHEKALADAVTAARTEALTEAGLSLVEAHIKAAARGKLSDEKVAKLLEYVDVKRFLGNDLKPDTAKVDDFINAQIPDATTGAGTGSGPDMGQGRRASGNATGIAAGAAEYAARRKSPASA